MMEKKTLNYYMIEFVVQPYPVWSGVTPWRVQDALNWNSLRFLLHPWCLSRMSTVIRAWWVGSRVM